MPCAAELCSSTLTHSRSAITLALWLIGGVSAFRAGLLVVSQLLGGIAAAGLIAALTPFGGAESVMTTLGEGVNVGQGLFIEVRGPPFERSPCMH